MGVLLQYCWDTTSSNPIDITVKEGEDFLGISRISGWKFKVEVEVRRADTPAPQSYWLSLEF